MPSAINTRRWLYQYLMLLRVGAVLYGVAGPLVDQHFTERLPYHGHLYLSGLPKAHTHFYFRDPPGDPGTDQHDQDILFLPGADVQYSPDSFVGWAWLTSPVGLLLAPILLSVLIGLGPRWRLVSTLLAPPDKPPRLFA